MPNVADGPPSVYPPRCSCQSQRAPEASHCSSNLPKPSVPVGRVSRAMTGVSIFLKPLRVQGVWLIQGLEA